MSKVVKVTVDLDNLTPPSAEFLARFKPHEELTEEDLDAIEAAAEADPDNPPATDEQLERAGFGREVRLLRRSLAMTQEQFAHTFRIQLGRLRDMEQGRYSVDGAIAAYIALIKADPERAQRVLASAA